MNPENIVAQLLENPYLHQTGFYRSALEGRCCDHEGNPLPWLALPAVQVLKDRVPYGIKVFEYGSGFGTLWWATRAQKVIAAEHDSAWHAKMSTAYPENVRVILKELVYGGEYCKLVSDIGRHMKFDVVVIDGRDRVNCAKNCLGALHEKGIVIFDNTERASYGEGLDAIVSAGFKKLSLEGLALSSPGGWTQTTILYRTENILGL